MLVWLRVWVGVIAAVALVSAVQSYLNGQYLQERIYTLQPHEATPLFSRMFGTWTLLAAVVRCAFALCPHNKSLFLVTFFTFLLAVLHFSSEVFLYQTADLSLGTILPLAIAGVSVLWMPFAWPLVGRDERKQRTD